MAQTGSSSEKNTTTDTTIEEVNGDVADPSNKNTMDQTPQPIEESKTTTEKKDEDKLIRRKKRLAESWFIIEYRRQYCQQHRVPWLPKGEVKEAKKKFHQMVEENPKIVEEYYEKFKCPPFRVVQEVVDYGDPPSENTTNQTDQHFHYRHVTMAPMSKEGVALEVFMVLYKRKHFNKNPGVFRLSDEEKKAAREEFAREVLGDPEMVKKYFDMCIDPEKNFGKDMVKKYWRVSKSKRKY